MKIQDLIKGFPVLLHTVPGPSTGFLFFSGLLKPLLQHIQLLFIPGILIFQLFFGNDAFQQKIYGFPPFPADPFCLFSNLLCAGLLK